MIRVAVAGCAGRMGKQVVAAVNGADDMVLACGIDPSMPVEAFPVYPSVAEALDAQEVDVLVDFTRPDVVAANLAEALPRGVDCVVGTTGLSTEQLEQLAALAPAGTTLVRCAQLHHWRRADDGVLAGGGKILSASGGYRVPP